MRSIEQDTAPPAIWTVQGHVTVRRLPDTLWIPGGARQRSQELTPLYVERFRGPLADRRLTIHPNWEMILICAGDGELVAEHPSPLFTGTVCLIPPGVAHTERSRHDIDVIWIGLRGQRVDSLPRDSPRIAQSAACIHGALTCWEVAYKAYGEIGTELDGWAHILFARFHQALNLGDDSTTRRLEESIGYLHAHYHEEIDVPALAAQCGYSEGYYYRVFKRLTGKTPIQYLMAVRVREALRWLVHSDLPIHRIAAAVGFADPHYFTRVIKQATGSTPCALRRNAAAAAE